MEQEQIEAVAAAKLRRIKVRVTTDRFVCESTHLIF